MPIPIPNRARNELWKQLYISLQPSTQAGMSLVMRLGRGLMLFTCNDRGPSGLMVRASSLPGVCGL